MKKKHTLSQISLLCILLAAMLLTSGCSTKSSTFDLAFCAPALDANLIDDTGADLIQAFPEMNSEDSSPVFGCVLAGDIPGDPLAGSTGLTQITSMLMTGEMDVLIATPEVARVQAINGLFMPLSEIFTESELEGLSGRILKYEFVDVIEGREVPTGQYTDDCGIDITGHELLAALFGAQKLGVYVAANTADLEQAKTVIRCLAGLEP